MRKIGRSMAAASLLVSVLLLSACSPVEEEVPTGEGPAKVTGEGVVLTADAVERLDMETDTVRDSGSKQGGARLVIPYASLFYGPTGDTWTYVESKARTYERAPVEVDHIDGNLVYLTDGPRSGTSVVTQGAAELFGVETGVDES